MSAALRGPPSPHPIAVACALFVACRAGEAPRPDASARIVPTATTNSGPGAAETGAPTTRVLRIEARSAPRRLFVYLHGYGASADDLHPIAKELATAFPDAESLLPDGFEAAPRGGRQWWSIVGMDADNRDARLRAGSANVERWLDAELASRGLGDRDVVLVGFSQGAALAADLGTRRRLGGIVSFCGRPGTVPATAIETPFLLVNGGEDPLVPSAEVATFAAALRTRGAPVTLQIHPHLAHSIDREGIDAARIFLTSL